MPRIWKFISSHPPNLIIGETSSRFKIRATLNKEIGIDAILPPKGIG